MFIIHVQLQHDACILILGNYQVHKTVAIYKIQKGQRKINVKLVQYVSVENMPVK